MNRRSGTTLVEVLVSIFVMGIGLLALLTLFPVGALHMAQAIRDDLTTHAGYDGAAIAEAKDLRNDSNIVSPTNAFNLYTQPDQSAQPQLKNLAQIPGYDGPSYPVLVDPFGYYGSLPGNAQIWVTGAYSPTYAVARISPSYVNAANYAYDTIRWFSLLDDIRFGTNGTPDLSTGEVEREGIITWAYLLRRPRANVATDVEMQVVVFNKRPIRLSQDTAQPNEYAFSAAFDTSANKVTLSWNPGNGQAAPQIRTGGWILDATIETAANGNPVPHGFFYRVTDVNDLGNNTMELQVDGGFREFAQGQTNLTGTVIIMDGVAEVFYKGPGWQP
jgi:hypothetical protein